VGTEWVPADFGGGAFFDDLGVVLRLEVSGLG
jgi:hypothetical protein